MLQRFAKKLHGRIAVSAAARHFIGRYFPGEYKVIPNGVDLRQFGDAPPFARWRDGIPNILFLGRFESRKGLMYLLRAYYQLRLEGLACRLLARGHAARRPPRRVATSPRASSAASRCSGASPTATRRAPSRPRTSSPRPRPARSRSGSCSSRRWPPGVPIVCSDIHGYKGVVRRNEQALLVPPRDSEALAAALAHLLRDPLLRERMGRVGPRARRAVRLGEHHRQGRGLLRLRHPAPRGDAAACRAASGADPGGAAARAGDARPAGRARRPSCRSQPVGAGERRSERERSRRDGAERADRSRARRSPRARSARGPARAAERRLTPGSRRADRARRRRARGRRPHERAASAPPPTRAGGRDDREDERRRVDERPRRRRVEVDRELEVPVPRRQDALVDVRDAARERQAGDVRVPDDEPDGRGREDAEDEAARVAGAQDEPGDRREHDEAEQREDLGRHRRASRWPARSRTSVAATTPPSVARATATMAPAMRRSAPAAARPPPSPEARARRARPRAPPADEPGDGGARPRGRAAPPIAAGEIVGRALDLGRRRRPSGLAVAVPAEPAERLCARARGAATPRTASAAATRDQRTTSAGPGRATAPRAGTRAR